MTSKLYRKLQVVKYAPLFREATKVVQIPLVPPSNGLVRVKNIFAGVNARDINVTLGRFPGGNFPFSIGMEALGVVDQIGSSVGNSTLKVGQPVLVVDSVHDGFSEYLYKAPQSLIPLPELKPNYLSAHINGLAASLSLDFAGKIRTGDKVLITAAAGGTGQMAVQWAKLRGAYVIGTTSTQEKANYLRELGVDLVINYKEENLEQTLKDRFPNGIDVVWDAVGGDTIRILFHHLAIRGRMVILGSTSSYQSANKSDFVDVQIENLHSKLKNKSQSLNGFSMFHYAPEIPEYLSKLVNMISDGKLKPRVDLGERSPGGPFFGIDQIHRAQEWLHSGQNLGKVVVQLQKA